MVNDPMLDDIIAFFKYTVIGRFWLGLADIVKYRLGLVAPLKQRCRSYVSHLHLQPLLRLSGLPSA